MSSLADRVRRGHLTTDGTLSDIQATLVKRIELLARVHVTWTALASTVKNSNGKVVESYPTTHETALLDVEFKGGLWRVYWLGANQK